MGAALRRADRRAMELAKVKACRHVQTVMLLYMTIEGGHRSLHWCSDCGGVRETHYSERKNRERSKWRTPKRPPC